MRLVTHQLDLERGAEIRRHMQPDFCVRLCHKPAPMMNISDSSAGPADGRAGDGRVRDAVPRNWVDRHAPPWSRPWLRLSRADRPIGTWLLLIPCWWAVALAAIATGWEWWDLWLFAGAGIGAFLMRGAGCTWNDFTDRHIDAAVARTRSRPLPSGQVSPIGALGWGVVQALIACLILLSFGWPAIGWGIASLGLVAIYPFAKRFTWWPQVFLGLAFNWGALLLWVAKTGGINVAPALLYLSGIAWTLHYDTIYAHQDRADDELVGVKSTARLFGRNTKPVLAGFASASVILAALAVLTAGGGLVAILGVGAFALHLCWQLWRLDIDDEALCLELFRSNNIAGLLLLAGLLVGSLF